MPISQKVNIIQGWPNPTIIDYVADPASGVTTIEAGKVGHLDTAGKWVLGFSAVNHEPCLFHNDQADHDAGNVSSDPTLYDSVKYGGVHGISLQNPLRFETVQFLGTPAVGDSLVIDTATGKFKVGSLAATPATVVNAGPVAGICTAASHQLNNLNYITVSAQLGRVL